MLQVLTVRAHDQRLPVQRLERNAPRTSKGSSGGNRQPQRVAKQGKLAVASAALRQIGYQEIELSSIPLGREVFHSDFDVRPPDVCLDPRQSA